MPASSQAHPPAEHNTDQPESYRYKSETYLLVQMQHEHNDREDGCRSYDGDGDPWDPLPGAEVQLSLPRLVTDGWDDDNLGIRDDALHVDKMLLGVFRGADEEVLDVVVRPAQSEVGIRSEQGLI